MLGPGPAAAASPCEYEAQRLPWRGQAQGPGSGACGRPPRAPLSYCRHHSSGRWGCVGRALAACAPPAAARCKRLSRRSRPRTLQPCGRCWARPPPAGATAVTANNCATHARPAAAQWGWAASTRRPLARPARIPSRPSVHTRRRLLGVHALGVRVLTPRRWEPLAQVSHGTRGALLVPAVRGGALCAGPGRVQAASPGRTELQ